MPSTVAISLDDKLSLGPSANLILSVFSSKRLQVIEIYVLKTCLKFS